MRHFRCLHAVRETELIKLFKPTKLDHFVGRSVCPKLQTRKSVRISIIGQNEKKRLGKKNQAFD